MGSPEVSWREKARRLKSELYALYFAYRDPRSPAHAKILAALIVGYAFSPIDLIPDFIPVLGYLDDVILVPLGIALAIRMIPAEVLAESRERARNLEDKPVNRTAAAVVVAIWLSLAAAVVLLLLRLT